MTGSTTRGSTDGLSSWFETALGRLVLERECRYLSQCARRFHGDTMLWFGPVGRERLEVELERSMVRHRIFGSTPDCTIDEPASLRCDGIFLAQTEALPLRTSYLDAVVVHHGLDQAEDPRTAIREFARVVTPGGWLVICGFNPFSLFGLRQLGSRLHQGRFARLSFVSPLRLLDWLAVLDFEVDGAVSHMVFRLPYDANEGGHKRWQRLSQTLESWRVPFGAVYLIMARKRAMRLTDPDRNEALRSRLNLIPMPKPAMRDFP